MLLVYEPVLQHHGVKGMRWGHRRYQNKDGSLTATGKKRYEKKERSILYKQAKKTARQLNRLDRETAYNYAERELANNKAFYNDIKIAKIKKKIEDKKNNRGRTSSRLENKLKKANLQQKKIKDVVKDYNKEIKIAEKKSSKIIKESLSNGMKFNSKGTLRTVMTRTDRAINRGSLVVDILLGVTGNSGAHVDSRTVVSGTKYRADKSIKKDGVKRKKGWARVTKDTPKQERGVSRQTYTYYY